jgi:hypothetical protein
MKKIIMLVLVVAAASYFWQRSKQTQGPEVISNPVYAEARVKMDFPGRSVEGVMLAKTADEADCQKHIQILERQLESLAASVCPTCKLQSSQCKAELPNRLAKLFDNTPTSVTYLSLARGERSEREFRVIYWGVTADESDRLCGAVSQFQKGRKGAVTCIRAQRE